MSHCPLQDFCRPSHRAPSVLPSILSDPPCMHHVNTTCSAVCVSNPPLGKQVHLPQPDRVFLPFWPFLPDHSFFGNTAKCCCCFRSLLPHVDVFARALLTASSICSRMRFSSPLVPPCSSFPSSLGFLYVVKDNGVCLFGCARLSHCGSCCGPPTAFPLACGAPPMCLDAPHDIKAKRQPFFVVVGMWSCRCLLCLLFTLPQPCST